MTTRTQHTPRPWSTHRWGADNKAVEILGPEGQTLADLEEKEEEGEAPRVALDEALANARLIAAAPDLVAALKAVVDELPVPARASNTRVRVYEAAKAALAKAGA